MIIFIFLRLLVRNCQLVFCEMVLWGWWFFSSFLACIVIVSDEGILLQVVFWFILTYFRWFRFLIKKKTIIVFIRYWSRIIPFVVFQSWVWFTRQVLLFFLHFSYVILMFHPKSVPPWRFASSFFFLHLFFSCFWVVLLWQMLKTNYWWFC